MQLKTVNKHWLSKEKRGEVVGEKLQERPAREENDGTSSESLSFTLYSRTSLAGNPGKIRGLREGLQQHAQE